MDTPPEPDLTQVQEMIQMAYQVAVDPDRFDDLLATWDRFFETAADTPNATLVHAHFAQAEQIAGDPQLDHTRSLEMILALVAGPALLVESSGQMVSANAAAHDMFGAQIATQVLTVLDACAWHPDPQGQPRHFAFERATERGMLAVATPVPLSATAGPLFLIRLEARNWSETMSAVLATEYALSQTEIEIARFAYEGLTPREMATTRGRSLETVRSQLKAVLAKTGTAKQTALLQLLSHLQYLSADTGNAPAARPRTPALHYFDCADGRRLACATYGARHGHKVLYLTTSSHPEESPEWREAVAQAGLFIIAPHRYGFGASVGQDADFLGDCAALASHLGGPLSIAGHREGGVLAAQLSQRLCKDVDIRATFLISTGAPGDAFDDSGSVMGSMKRSITASRAFPAALRLGYHAAKRVFQSGTPGQRKIVTFFVNDCPVDKVLIRDPHFYDLVRRNIAYCFEDTDRIVADIGLWGARWDATLSPDLPLTFVQGGAHCFLDGPHTAQSVEENPARHLYLIPGASQLLLYQKPSAVARAIAAHALPETA